MKIIDRFDKYMKYKGLNDNKVTIQLGLSVGTIGKSRKPNRDLSSKLIEMILKFYTDLSRIWLLTGEGEMIKQPDNQPTSICIENAHKVTDSIVTCGSTLPDLIPVIPKNLYMQPNIDVLEYIRHNPEIRTSPVVRQFSDYEIYYIVHGGDMAPYFLPGDKLALATYPQGEEDSVIDGRAYVVDTYNNGLLLRQLYKEDGGFLARSYNDRYRDEFIKYSQVIRVYRILGLIRSYT